jgi:hypothetical protein
MGMTYKGIETVSGTEGGANARRHICRVAVKAKGQVLFLNHRPYVCMQGATRSKGQDQKRARVHTERGRGQPSDGYGRPPHGPSTTPCTATHPKQIRVLMASIAGPQICGWQ